MFHILAENCVSWSYTKGLSLVSGLDWSTQASKLKGSDGCAELPINVLSIQHTGIKTGGQGGNTT